MYELRYSRDSPWLILQLTKLWSPCQGSSFYSLLLGGVMVPLSTSFCSELASCWCSGNARGGGPLGIRPQSATCNLAYLRRWRPLHAAQLLCDNECRPCLPAAQGSSFFGKQMACCNASGKQATAYFGVLAWYSLLSSQHTVSKSAVKMPRNCLAINEVYVDVMLTALSIALRPDQTTAELTQGSCHQANAMLPSGCWQSCSQAGHI